MDSSEPAIILDVDGTLVDTNYHHVLAWFRAFRRHDIVLPLWRIHRHMGMGGDHLVAALAGDGPEEKLGDSIRAAEKELYGELIGEVEPLEGSRELLEELHEAQRCVVLASSAKHYELEHYLDLLDAREPVTAWTDASDVKATKPEPDLIYAALDKVGAGTGVMIGDSTFDCEAAKRAGIPSMCVLTGGFSREELTAAGASKVFASLRELRTALWEEVPAQ